MAEEAVRIGNCIVTALKALQAQFAELSQLRCNPANGTNCDTAAQHTFMELRRLEALGRLQEAVQRLRSFAEVNHAALYKILKKHDKRLARSDGLDLALPRILEATGLQDLSALDALHGQIRDASRRCSIVEGLEASADVARIAAGLGADGMANSCLRGSVPESNVGRGMFFFLGASSSLLFTIVLIIYLPVSDPSTFSAAYFLSSFNVFNLVLSMVLTLWAMGLVSLACQRSHINHNFILDIDPRCSLGYQVLFKKAATLTAMWILCLTLYIVDYKWMVVAPIGARTGFNKRSSFHFVLYPLILLVASVSVLLTPTPFCRCKYVLGIFRSLGRTMLAPCYYVCFADNITGDVLTSLATPLKDVPKVICYLASHHPQTKENVRRFLDNDDVCGNWNKNYCEVAIGAAPFVFRLLQCARRFRDTREPKHLCNLGKYGASLLVVFLSSWTDLHPICYAGVLTLATVYAAAWDILMDWGLGPRELLLRRGSDARDLTAPTASLISEAGAAPGAPKVRGEPRHFSARVYWLAILFDVAARFSWVHTLMPERKLTSSIVARTVLRTMLTTVEIGRRSLWTVLRIEHEQVSNAGGFRALLWVPASIGATCEQSAELQAMPNVAELTAGPREAAPGAAE